MPPKVFSVTFTEAALTTRNRCLTPATNDPDVARTIAHRLRQGTASISSTTATATAAGATTAGIIHATRPMGRPIGCGIKATSRTYARATMGGGMAADTRPAMVGRWHGSADESLSG